MVWHSLASQLFNGLALGMIYVLLALGLNIILGLMGVVNFAHGAFFMAGAMLAFAFTGTAGFWPAVLIGAVIAAALGLLVEMGLIRHVYLRIPEYGLLLTFGLAVMMEQVARIIWGDYPQPMSAPPGLRGSVNLGFTSAFPTYRVALMGIAVLVTIGVWLFLTRTSYGMIIRAGIQDRLMVGALGINLPLTFTMVFALGTALAALAGGLSGPVYGVYPSMGSDFVILAFVVVIVGGAGSFWGAVVGGLIIGVVQSLAVMFWPPATFVAGYVVLAVVLLLRPRGLLGVEGILE